MLSGSRCPRRVVEPAESWCDADLHEFALISENSVFGVVLADRVPGPLFTVQAGH